MHKKFFFSNKIYKNPVTFFKNGCKKLFSSQNVMKKKLFEKHYSLKKIVRSEKSFLIISDFGIIKCEF